MAQNWAVRAPPLTARFLPNPKKIRENFRIADAYPMLIV